MFTDALGRRINANDIVTYPVRRGSSMYIRSGKVVGLDLDNTRGIIVSINGRNVKVTETERVTVAIRGADLLAGCSK